jgi:hypothetical protein
MIPKPPYLCKYVASHGKSVSSATGPGISGGIFMIGWRDPRWYVDFQRDTTPKFDHIIKIVQFSISIAPKSSTA